MPRITAILGLLADVSSGQKNLFTLYLLMYIFSRAFSNAVSDKLFVGESLNSTTISNLTANVCFYMERFTLLPAIARMLCDTYSTRTTAQFSIRITHLQGPFWHTSGR